MRKNTKRVCNLNEYDLLEELERRLKNRQDIASERLRSRKEDLESKLEAIEEAEDTLRWTE